MNFLFNLVRFDWWVYPLVVVSFFSLALLLNYIVKKINESRIEERFVRLRHIGSNTRSIQVQRQLENTVPLKSPLEVVAEPSNQSTLKGISLVFNRDDNLMEDRRKKDQIEIMNYPDSQNLSIASDVADMSTCSEIKTKLSEVKNNEITKSPFLGTIYKELTILEKSKNLYNSDKDSLHEDIVDKMVLNMQENKATPSSKKLPYIQNDDELKKWTLVEKKNTQNKQSKSERKERNK